jgi:hypothetical protein
LADTRNPYPNRGIRLKFPSVIISLPKITEKMDVAIKFNETGCHLYELGRGDEAFELFSGAMQAMNCSQGGKNKHCLDPLAHQLFLIDPSIQRGFDRLSRSGGVGVDSTVCCTASPLTSTNSTTIQQQMNTKKEQKDFLSHDAPFMCTDILRMSQIEHLRCDPEMYFCAVFSIVLYNQALVLHRGQVANSLRSLERALTFYSLAGRSLLEPAPSGYIQSHKVLSDLCCAILNNTGYVLHETGDFEYSRLCFMRLRDFLQTLPPTTNEVDRRRREEYELNFVLFYRFLSTAAAA